MARPAHTSPSFFTSRELAVAASLTARNMGLLIEQRLAPEAVEYGSGKSGHRRYDAAALAHAALIGCLQSAGFELLVSARLAAAFADDHAASHGRLPSNLGTFLHPPLNPGKSFPWGKTPDDPDISFEQDFWLHHLLRNRSSIYVRGKALKGDFIIEIADHAYVMTRILDLEKVKVFSPVSRDGLPVSIEYRIAGRGSAARIVPAHMELNSLDFSVDPVSAEQMRRLEQDYLKGRRDAETIVNINLSLGIRNAFDRVQDDRETRGGILESELQTEG
ncbi:MAG: hypothetical protein EOR25_22415 [Mesorhizobium sp.]|uniref:hypothetical protein n=1 Tax=Mesorhizobium sp. TaxID=1871066 RepID=UPI000FE3C06F|nr:hypothetical protein [Mesorhizobium sp.]RWJ04456.1 MAG: hypothetical protein EOR24_30660 [Mesorhizobium sp.]RWJ15219.1 MAG: hypothetical protein EOR25_22415 [Mesorhizobium sp.]